MVFIGREVETKRLMNNFRGGINTIASLTRTAPDRARVLLREFAVFYRRTLEDAQDMIELDREMDQTQRYFAFELASVA